MIAHSALEAALRQNLRDEASWTVYADWLSSEGDSRGELIGYEQRADRETDPILSRQWRQRAKQLFERDHQHWLGPLRMAAITAALKPTWTRGFVTEAFMHDGRTASTLLSMRTGALLYRLGFTRLADCRSVAEALRDSWVELVELRSLDNTKIEPLAEIEGLRELSLTRCKIDDIAALAELPALECVIAHESEFDLRGFEGGFATLRHLALVRHRWQAPPAGGKLHGLEKLPALEILDLHDSRIESLQPLRRLTKLRQLDISNTDVRSLAPLEYIETLERVDASDLGHLENRDAIEHLRERGVVVETQPRRARLGP